MTSDDMLGCVELGDWNSVLEAAGGRPELLESRLGWAEQTLLHLAVIAGRADVAGALLDLGADVMARDGADHATPLHWAADGGDVEMARLIAERGGDLNAANDVHGWGPLGWATLGEMRPAMAAWLLEAGARPTLFPLIALDREEELARLLEDDPKALEKRLSEWEHHESPLQFAIARGSERSFAALLAAGAEPDALDWLGLSPLAVAGFWNRPGVGEELRRRGAVDDLSSALALGLDRVAEAALAREPAALGPEGRYRRLLHYAAENGHAEAARWLLDHGADPNALLAWWDNRLAPLHTAASHGHVELVRLLVERGGDLELRDVVFEGLPIGWAEHHGRAEVVALLGGAVP